MNKKLIGIVLGILFLIEYFKNSEMKETKTTGLQWYGFNSDGQMFTRSFLGSWKQINGVATAFLENNNGRIVILNPLGEHRRYDPATDSYDISPI